MASSSAWSKLLPLGLGAVVILGAGTIGFLRRAESGEGPARSGTAAAPKDPSLDPESTEVQFPEKPFESSRPRSSEPRPPRTPGVGTPAAAERGRTPAAVNAARLKERQAKVLDEKLEPGLRVRELESLQQLRGLNAKVTESMLKLLSHTDDDRLRSKILRGLKGDSSDPFKFEALSRLTQDPSAMVRKAAAGALLEFRTDPLIANALQNSSRSDPDPAVRRESEESLTRPTDAEGPAVQKRP